MVTVISGSLPAWAKGYGYGFGYGDGDGSGSGYGYGYGYGFGYGDGSGSGYGDGYGDGDGSGSGYGYGFGYGDGSGSGYGYGFGYGDGSYWLSTVEYFASKWSEAQKNRLATLQKLGAKIAFWRSNADGTPANGGRYAPVKVGDIHEEHGPLRNECGRGQLHATLIPPKWEGERVWIVALHGEVRGDDEKYWALKREIIGEAL